MQLISSGDLRKVLSSTYKGDHKPAKPSGVIFLQSASASLSDALPLNGKTRCLVNNHSRATYTISNHKASFTGSLVDHGANGGIAGSDGRIVYNHTTPQYVYVCGIDSHQMTGLPIVTIGSVVPL